MPKNETRSETWKKMVLRSMPPPAWLGSDAPQGDVVVSTRVRIARNLRGLRFPHHADRTQLLLVEAAVAEAGTAGGLIHQGRLTEAERDFLLGSRLISADFAPSEPGRALLLDRGRTLSVIVNEEDHVRIQSLTAGWSLPTARLSADAALRSLEERLDWAHAEPWGYLTASPANCGRGTRWSALFHLIGLAHTRRLPQVLKALAVGNMTARGLFGESSRAVGALFQVSTVRGDQAEFVGAVEYLLSEERIARREVTRLELQDLYAQAYQRAIASPDLDLREALQILAWARWAASAGLGGAPESPRDVDMWVSTMEVFGTQDLATAARHRADFVRKRLEPAWRRRAATPGAHAT